MLTTGTGSGKSLAYIVPIVDHVLQERRREGPSAAKRVQAIVVYPMNALANSQLEELEKFLRDGYGEGREPVTFARYTGQEDDEKRQEIRDNPPDILLTNYVMLELSSPGPTSGDQPDHAGRGACSSWSSTSCTPTAAGRAPTSRCWSAGCARPARRSEPAVRRHLGDDGDARARSRSSATRSSPRSRHAVRHEVTPGARHRRDPGPRHRRARPTTVPAERLRVAGRAARVRRRWSRDPLARWIETRFGLAHRRGHRAAGPAAAHHSRGRGRRAGRADRGRRGPVRAGDPDALWRPARRRRHPVTERPLFAFRLHQFLSKGDTVYVTLEDQLARHLTRTYQLEQPGSRRQVAVAAGVLPRVRPGVPDGRGAPRRTARSGTTPAATPPPAAAAAATATCTSTASDAVAGRRRVRRRRPPAARVLAGARTTRDRRSSKKSYRAPAAACRHRRRATAARAAASCQAAFVPAPFRFCLRCGVSLRADPRPGLRQARHARPGGPLLGDLADLGVDRALAAGGAGGEPRQGGAQAPHLRRQPAGRLPAGRPLQRLRPGHAAARRAVPGGRGRGRGRHRTTRSSPRGSPRRSASSLADYAGETRTCRRPLAATRPEGAARRRRLPALPATWSAAGASPCRTWSRPACCEIDYADLDWVAGRAGPLGGHARGAARRRPGAARGDHAARCSTRCAGPSPSTSQYFRDDFDSLQRASEERLIGPVGAVRRATGRRSAPPTRTRPGPAWTARLCSCRRAASSASTCARGHVVQDCAIPATSSSSSRSC